MNYVKKIKSLDNVIEIEAIVFHKLFKFTKLTCNAITRIGIYFGTSIVCTFESNDEVNNKMKFDLEVKRLRLRNEDNLMITTIILFIYRVFVN